MLIVMACSATKRTDPGELPAINRYDGPMWRTLRTALADLPDDRRPEVWFLSARYGFHPATLPIVNYEALLTEARARDLLRIPSSNHVAFAEEVRRHRHVLFAGGQLYRDTMQKAVALVPVVPEETDGGGIGTHRAQLRAWMTQHCQPTTVHVCGGENLDQAQRGVLRDWITKELES
jgi:hypothetical protein